VRELPVLAFEAFWGEGDRVLVSGAVNFGTVNGGFFLATLGAKGITQ